MNSVPPDALISSDSADPDPKIQALVTKKRA